MSKLKLLLKDGNSMEGHALDVYAKDGAEWLRFREDTGQESVIRLDRIQKFSESLF